MVCLLINGGRCWEGRLDFMWQLSRGVQAPLRAEEGPCLGWEPSRAKVLDSGQAVVSLLLSFFSSLQEVLRNFVQGK